ncbi:MAG: cobyrinate a,c-diamide synthase [Betaproteobacteria bacterium HGW-Betaproteobacteria-11]|nr:MAG: cobyrinate a,c-diamide synthase [Betaproteobacteria bacterium HGW-Betaproteobacteria-11]
MAISLLIAAPASGQGKTSIVAGLARLYARQGKRVRVFKCGPDFLDPMIHAVASGHPCENLDLWMCGEEDAAWRLARAAQEADVVLVEGVMGLFDGTPSAADLARRFDLPVLAVIDAGAMAQTFGAIAHGLATYQPELPFYGVLANRVASPGHAEMLAESLPANLRWCGAIPRDEAASLPERHLGLHQAGEISDLMARLERLADHLEKTPLAELSAAEFALLCTTFRSSPSPTFHELPALPALLAGRTLAIARDAAFCFLYPANLELLETLGARLVFFSPLAGEALPACDALWLPGGYPELHAAILSARREFFAGLAAHVAAGKPLLAECGGMMTLFDTLTDGDGATHAMACLLPGRVAMQPRLAALGGQEAALPEGVLRGHTFHYSQTVTPLVPLVHAHRQRPLGGISQGEAVYRQGRLTASYVHFYFPSNPAATAALFLP